MKPSFIIDLHSKENDLFVRNWLIEIGYKFERIDKDLPAILKFNKTRPNKNGVWGSLLAINKS